MKLTKQKLKQIIKEELAEVTDRDTVIDPDTGEERPIQFDQPSWKQPGYSSEWKSIGVPAADAKIIVKLIEDHYSQKTFQPGEFEAGIKEIWETIQEMGSNLYNA